MWFLLHLGDHSIVTKLVILSITCKRFDAK